MLLEPPGRVPVALVHLLVVQGRGPGSQLSRQPDVGAGLLGGAVHWWWSWRCHSVNFSQDCTEVLGFS